MRTGQKNAPPGEDLKEKTERTNQETSKVRNRQKRENYTSLTRAPCQERRGREIVGKEKNRNFFPSQLKQDANGQRTNIQSSNAGKIDSQVKFSFCS